MRWFGSCPTAVVRVWVDPADVALMHDDVAVGGQEVEMEVSEMSWGQFKPLLTDALVAHLHPVQVRDCVLVVGVRFVVSTYLL